MSPEQQPNTSPAEKPDTVIDDAAKAHILADVENKWRDDANHAEASAAAARIMAEQGSDMQARIAAGYEGQAAAIREDIPRIQEQLGAQYDEVTSVVDQVKARDYGATTPEAAEHRAQMDAHLDQALENAGMIGEKPFNSNETRFTQDPNVQQAYGHAVQASGDLNAPKEKAA